LKATDEIHCARRLNDLQASSLLLNVWKPGLEIKRFVLRQAALLPSVCSVVPIGHAAAAGPAVRVPWRAASIRDGSGRGGGDGGSGIERIDRRLADEEAEDLAQRIVADGQPVPGGFGIAVLFFLEGCAAAGFFPHQTVDGVATAEPVHDVEQGVAKAGVAEARDDGEIEQDGEVDAADGEAADLALEFLQGWHMQFGIVEEARAICALRAPGGEGFNGLGLRRGREWRG
jgi:hypothetical protein